MGKKTIPQTHASLPIGYLPCFSRYLYDKFPLEDFYRNKVFVNKISVILSEVLTCNNPQVDLKERTECKSIMHITPDSAEGKRIIKMCSWSGGKLHRLDFGNNKMRVIVGIEDSEDKRLFHVFGLDAKHDTFPIGKNQR